MKRAVNPIDALLRPAPFTVVRNEMIEDVSVSNHDAGCSDNESTKR